MIYRHTGTCCVLYERSIEAGRNVIDIDKRGGDDGLPISPFTVPLLVGDIDNNRHIVRE
jgi:hypothetical protein